MPDPNSIIGFPLENLRGSFIIAHNSGDRSGISDHVWSSEEIVDLLTHSQVQAA
jgi:hypothetical protein